MTGAVRCGAARGTTCIRPCTARPARREGGRLCVMEHQGWCLLVTPGILAGLAGKRSSPMGMGWALFSPNLWPGMSAASSIDQAREDSRLCCAVLSCFTARYCFLLAPRIFSASTSSIAYRCVTIASQATSIKPCALLGLPREKPWMVPSLFSRPKPKPSHHAVAHCIDYSTCGYSPRFASRASWQHHCRCLSQILPST